MARLLAMLGLTVWWLLFDVPDDRRPLALLLYTAAFLMPAFFRDWLVNHISSVNRLTSITLITALMAAYVIPGHDAIDPISAQMGLLTAASLAAGCTFWMTSDSRVVPEHEDP